MNKIHRPKITFIKLWNFVCVCVCVWRSHLLPFIEYISLIRLKNRRRWEKNSDRNWLTVCVCTETDRNVWKMRKVIKKTHFTTSMFYRIKSIVSNIIIGCIQFYCRNFRYFIWNFHEISFIKEKRNVLLNSFLFYINAIFAWNWTYMFVILKVKRIYYRCVQKADHSYQTC